MKKILRPTSPSSVPNRILGLEMATCGLHPEGRRNQESKTSPTDRSQMLVHISSLKLIEPCAEEWRDSLTE